MTNSSIITTNINMASLVPGEDYVFSKDAYYKPIVYNDLKVQILDFRCLAHPDNWVTIKHKHPWYSFVYTSIGSSIVNIEGNEFLVEKDRFIVIPPGVTHWHRANGEGNTGFRFRFTLEKIKPSDGDCQPIADEVINAFDNCQVKAYTYPASKILEDVYIKPAETLPCYFIAWLMDICGVIAPLNREVNTYNTAEPHKADIVKQIDMFIEDFYASDLSPNDLTYSLNYSYRHLSRIYKEATGINISERISQLRMQKASELLAETTLGIQDIAEHVGFHSYASFFKAFSAYHGCSPSEYRSSL